MPYRQQTHDLNWLALDRFRRWEQAKYIRARVNGFHPPYDPRTGVDHETSFGHPRSDCFGATVGNAVLQQTPVNCPANDRRRRSAQAGGATIGTMDVALDPVREQLKVAFSDHRRGARTVRVGAKLDDAMIGIGEDVGVHRSAFGD